ncbi:MAG TPA: hypothetical protein VGP08_17360, partial [Pyrinomonadaceae bacterium]|nr:hypothetical protein [Pyrinomonadaceae bacterium]
MKTLRIIALLCAAGLTASSAVLAQTPATSPTPDPKEIAAASPSPTPTAPAPTVKESKPAASSKSNDKAADKTAA